MKKLTAFALSLLLATSAYASDNNWFKVSFQPSVGADSHVVVVSQEDWEYVTEVDPGLGINSAGDIVFETDTFPIISEEVTVGILALMPEGVVLASNTKTFPAEAFAVVEDHSFYIDSADFTGISGSFSVGFDDEALSGTVVYPNGAGDDKNGSQRQDSVKYTVDIPASGNWKLWIRMKAVSGGDDNAANSFWMTFDSFDTRLGNNPVFDEWFWDGDGYDDVRLKPVDLGLVSEGAHTLTIYKREADGLQQSPGIDLIYLTNVDGTPGDNYSSFPTTTSTVTLLPSTTIPNNVSCDLDFNGTTDYDDLRILVELLAVTCN